MISFSSHSALLILLSLLLLIIATCDAAGCLWKPTRLNINNDLGPGLDLTIHCKSKNNDLGQHVVPFGGEYTIDFCSNFWRSTLFFCGVSWSGKFHWFDVYDASRDSSRREARVAIVMRRINEVGKGRWINYDKGGPLISR
ncbi:hypothetical protein NC652_040310 [Populus alba x Populus x berolinensis]|nr:hypothetical protein NC652_040310 [Populus alba x Populus x berolinensis]